MSDFKPRKKLSWTPIRRRGIVDIYCSPACGRGCTYKEFEKATNEAKKWANKLTGFEPHVWENLGWHWCLTAKTNPGHVDLHFHARDSWGVLASADDFPGGNCEWGSFEVSNPHHALAQLANNLRKAVAYRQRFLNEVTELQHKQVYQRKGSRQ